MAFNDLVGGECGGANPLMKLTSHFVQDKSLRQEGIVPVPNQLHQVPNGGLQEETMARQFMAQHRPGLQAANTFDMQHLLGSIQPDASLTGDVQRVHSAAPVDMASRWHEAHSAANGPVTAAPFHHQQPSAMRNSKVQFPQSSSGGAAWAPPAYLTHPALRQSLTSMALPQQTWQSAEAKQQWAAEFKAKEAAETASKSDEETELQRTAKKLLSEMNEAPVASLKDTEFADFVRSVGDGEVDFNDQETASAANQWTDDFLRGNEADHGEPSVLGNPDYWEHLQKEWEKAMHDDRAEAAAQYDFVDDFKREYEEKEYEFNKDNTFLDHSNPFEEGLKKLQEGDLATAILYFEAEVTARPNNAQGWQYLGTTLANNEQEPEAIVALKKCLALDSQNLTALMTLAVGLTNEKFTLQACETLCEWLKVNPKYTHLADRSPPPAAEPQPFTSSLMTQSQFLRAQDLYIEAARLHPESPDPDVQVGLGVLLHLASEFDKAVDCFNVAVGAQPDNALLWNKLGATLANANRSAEAVDAYRQALALSPGFVRCRYNLGISCMNLGAYREASEHFLSALDQQRQGNTPDGRRSTMSDSIWRTLRTCMVMNGADPKLIALVDDLKLDSLLKELGVQPV